MNKLKAIKSLSKFINANAQNSEERMYLHDCLSKLEE